MCGLELVVHRYMGSLTLSCNPTFWFCLFVFYTGKRQRENEELLEYMEKADDKFLQLNKDMTAKMETDTSALLGLMARMVAVMEAQAKK